MRYRNSVKNVDQVNLVQAIARCALEGERGTFWPFDTGLSMCGASQDYLLAISTHRLSYRMR